VASIVEDRDELIARAQKWIANELGLERVANRARIGKEDEQRLSANAA